jgi:hypothetical protein
LIIQSLSYQWLGQKSDADENCTIWDSSAAENTKFWSYLKALERKS